MARKERFTHNRGRGSLSGASSGLSPKQVDLRLQQYPNDLNELRYSFHIGVFYAFSVSRCSAIRHVAINRDLPPKPRMIILYESLL
jgi:hypothetical protein